MEQKFKEFNNKKIIDKVCETHQVNYWQISTPIRGSSERRLQEFCPECAREGIQQKKQELIKEQVNKQAYIKTYDVLMRDSLIPSELRGATFENFIVSTTEEQQMLDFVKEQVKKYLNGMTGNTLITGSTGIGKSHLSLAMAKAINEGFKAENDSKSVLFISLTEIIKQIKKGWNYGRNASLTEYEAVERLTSVDFLIIDDLGAKNATISPKSDWEQDFLFDIINSRETTIFNTNLDSNEIRTVYNARNSSRILKGLEGNSFKAFSIKDKRYTLNKLRRKI
ncbi:ATP-binding protein [Streptococcus dysgalactiae]|uniref:Phage replication protein n=1 Tax=Streptococcus dysgalactiae subsp. equisimilis TaxID=119602 RepID=A0AAE9QRR0_STREQ|nr:ATP-binding protein [Streptococcus dysgalactiae]KKC22093.1 GTP-binding protein [Streptococcus dysgalactiae subsp. equisimilis]QBX07686.1 helicase loader [Streptococcus satellite phage Javan167]VTT17571.1 putative phage replication protein [Streptococcus dysgalactiae]VTT23191.1 putative phage replication protein [Streptococcus dysgalactiae subsp. equisimilis]